jgi:predicted ester cyclase
MALSMTDAVLRAMLRMEGSHTGDFGDLAPTGVQVQVSGVTIFRTANGQIAEASSMPDALGLISQLTPDPVA